MRLIIRNESRRNVDLNITPPLRRGRPVCSPVLKLNAGCTMEIDGSTREIAALSNEIKRAGATARREADHV